MKIIIVDINDNQIGVKESDMISYEDIYRVSALWLTDTQSGDALIAQRKYTKHNDPGKWSASVSGTVDEGETYTVNVIKEIEEEIGLTNLHLTTGPKEYIDNGKQRFFVQWFVSSIDKNKTAITIQEEEVEGVKWISENNLAKDVINNPDKYVPRFGDSLKVLGY